ncbi:MAG TPA: DUF1801 domain-containing protein [Rhizomicrobium sp.]|jgi:hypothetical protein
MKKTSAAGARTKQSDSRKGKQASAAKPANEADAAKQLDGFIRKYTPEMGRQIRDILARMRAHLPGAFELVYDNYNALAIGFASGDRVRDVIFSIACYPRWVSLFFFPGVGLEDPAKLLKGNGTKCRHIVLRGPEMLDELDVTALMRQALERAGNPIDPRVKARIVIKSVSAKQRPRRPGIP